MATTPSVLSNGYRPLQVVPTTVVLVGAGAVENSWQPVRRALLRYHPGLPEGEENLAFATTILELRHLAAVRAAGWRLYLRDGLRGPRVYWTVRRALRDQLRRYRELKRDIVSELQTAFAEGQIRVRPAVVESIRSWTGADRTSYVIVTTNWDLALEQSFEAARVYHLHGHVVDPTSLYLPAEQSWEAYRYFDEGRFAVPQHAGLITHGNWLMTGVRRLAIVGLSLSPLDAELRSLLMSAADAGRRKIDEVEIVDLDPEVVSRRLTYYTRNSIGRIILTKPSREGPS